jgi:hypothetical protein
MILTTLEMLVLWLGLMFAGLATLTVALCRAAAAADDAEADNAHPGAPGTLAPAASSGSTTNRASVGTRADVREELEAAVDENLVREPPLFW